MTIGERIKLLRKELKMSQTEFGQRIGLKQAAIGLYENGNRSVSEQSIYLISQAYQVRAEWLRTGEGPQRLNELQPSWDDSSIDDADRTIINMYLALSPDKRKFLKEYILKLAHELQPDTNNASSNLDIRDSH
ncbi:MAG: helix-turn-helix transcriptional regulator [Selenomonas sp.]|nr:helix-turn-helix transcriptional regulator [Selenomonas sp.]